MRQDANTFHNLRGAVLHQTIVRRNVRFALCGIDNKRGDFIAAALQFNAGGKTCAAKPGNAILMNALNERFTAVGAVIRPALAFNPAVLAVGINDDA